MRVIARITIPVEAGNRAIKNGSLGAVMQETAERWKPEAMYFTAFDSQRTAIIVFDLPDASDIPVFAEPLFERLDAGVELAPVMTADDLRTGVAKLL